MQSHLYLEGKCTCYGQQKIEKGGGHGQCERRAIRIGNGR